MSQPAQPMEVKGHNGTVVFDGQFVSIERKGFLARISTGKGSKRIPVKSLTAVHFKPAGPLMNGYIEFVFSGAEETKSGFGTATIDAAKNENAVLFTRGQLPVFEALRDAVEAAMVAPAPTASAGSVSTADELAKLAEQHKQGVLSDEDFAAAKARLLG
ncbi:hypothetical protein GCM10012275_54680 [Longimycelium tulufanense]|uniref:SHOCT domain-containing protein n=1 Tax=Longimycelium tulufanense TaxID=907463 RepID=A0A8J3FXW2_9PSEU|nr:hypothetical protein GCM10012275_54680 [Longimycelium tulufanense]